MSEARWYVLDDGKGYGIEGYGRASGDHAVYLPRLGDASGGIHGMASQLAWWYQWDLPNAGGGQGNPLFKLPGAGNRALVIAAVDMMMIQECIDSRSSGGGSPLGCTSGWGDRTDFIGGYLIATAETVLHTAELISDPVRLAFFDGMELLVDRMLELGARDVNSNMDGKAVEGCALAWRATELHAPNHAVRAKCEDLSRLVLFGYVDGQIDTKPYKIDSDKGIFYLEGLVREADGPETTYNGRSLAHIAAARATTLGKNEWKFLDGVLTRMCDFMFYQFYQQPYVPSNLEKHQTPTGYSNRTFRGMRSPQDTPWGNMMLAYLYTECKPAIWNWKFNQDYVVETPSQLEPSTEYEIDELSTVPEYSNTAIRWVANEPWPSINPYTPPETGWHAQLRSVIDSEGYLHMNDPRRKESYSRTFPDETDATDEMQNQEQWWARRAGSTGNEFAYFIEGTVFSGTYKGFYSGKIEAFWRMDQGPVILSLVNPYFDWDEANEARVDHVWGRDEKGSLFSWGKVNGSTDPNDPTARNVTWDKASQTFTVVSRMEDRGESTENEISGVVTLTKTFHGLPNGLEVTTSIESDQTDEITELWNTIPIYEGGYGDENKMPNNFVVEFLDSDGWHPLTSTRQTADLLRIGHDWGQGLVYTSIQLDAPTPVRLMPADPNVGDDQHVHLLQLDLHGAPGTAGQFPASVAVSYQITVPESEGGPSVALTTPGEGATFQAPADIMLKATATDIDGSVSKVEFFEGDNKLGEDKNGADGWSLMWSNVAEGNYTLEAVATDNEGLLASSAPTDILVDNASTNQLPEVTLDDPRSDDTFAAPADVRFSATASDADGVIVKVEFYQGSTRLGEDTTVEDGWSFVWENVASGNYTVSAMAYDNDGASSKTTEIEITIDDSAVNQSPTVSMFRPADGESFKASSDIKMVAVASDPDGFIAKVEFYVDDALVGEDTQGNNGWNYTWRNVPEGAYSLKATAYDNEDARKSSVDIGIIVEDNTSNSPPVVSIVAPTSGDVVDVLSDIEIVASALDNDGDVTHVEFFANRIKLGDDTDGSDGWSVVWKDAVEGDYGIQARAYDNDGARKMSGKVRITVQNGGGKQPQAISFVAPISGEIYEAPAEVKLAAAVNDAGGLVTQVEFYVGSAKLAHDANGNDGWGVTWSGMPPGKYTLKAVATNDQYASTTSKVVVIDIVEPTSIANEDPQAIKTFALHQNFPNPFRKETTLVFEMAENSDVDLSVFDMTGRLVSQLYKGEMPMGVHRVSWQSNGLAGGIYLIRLQTREGVFYRRATLIN